MPQPALAHLRDLRCQYRGARGGSFRLSPNLVGAVEPGQVLLDPVIDDCNLPRQLLAS